MKRFRGHKGKKSLLGQGTTEFVLLLPILMALFSLIVLTFRSHHEAKEEAVTVHFELLDEFDHGNGGPLVIDGKVVIPEPGRLTIGEAPDSIWEALGNQLLNQLKNQAAQMFLDNIFDSIGFFNGSTYVSEYARAYSTTAVTSFAETGSVDWSAAQRAGYAAALSSNQAIGHFQGADFDSAGFRELFGSTLQQAAISYSQAGGDWSAAAGGAVGGFFDSETSGGFFADGSYEVLKGATKGAIRGSLAGLASGQKVQVADVFKMAGTGAFQTKTVARLLPGSTWNGEDTNPMSSASYGAANAAFSTLMNLGTATTFEDFALASMEGAFFSGQTMDSVVGEGGDKTQWARRTLGTAGFRSGVMLLQGKGGDAVAQQFIGNVAGAGAAYAGNLIKTPINRGIQIVTSGVSTVLGVKGALAGMVAGKIKGGVEQGVRSIINKFKGEEQSEFLGVYPIVVGPVGPIGPFPPIASEQESESQEDPPS